MNLRQYDLLFFMVNGAIIQLILTIAFDFYFWQYMLVYYALMVVIMFKIKTKLNSSDVVLYDKN